MPKKPTWIDACHGIGGFRLGFEAAGWRCVEAFDIKKSLVKEYEARGWKSRQANILEIDCLEPADLLVCGAPCQPHSTANAKRQKHSEERVEATIPARIFGLATKSNIPLVLIENVEGILSSKKCKLFGEILVSMAESGYDAQWGLVDCATLGATGRRRRVLILGVAQGSGAVHRLFEGPDIPKGVCARKRTSTYPWCLTNGSTKHVGWGSQLILDFCPEGKLRRYRSLGLREAEFIAGFPKGWTDGFGVSTAIGRLADAFPPPAAYTVAKELKKFV